MELLTSYIKDNKILSTLAKENNICIKTLQNYIKSLEIARPLKLNLKELVLLIDATYWGTSFGVVVFKDAISKKFIWWHFINRKEKLDDYLLGFKWCLKQGYTIKAIVSDGFKGLAKTLYPIPFQICQFHIQRLVQTKLTKKPKSLAAIELLTLSKGLTELDKERFINKLNAWQERHKDYLNEKSVDENNKWRYTHQRVRSANYTLKRNLAFLFTYESIENLPRTNNSLEGEFTHLKTKLRVHSGLKLENKMKFISNYFVIKNGQKRLRKF